MTGVVGNLEANADVVYIASQPLKQGDTDATLEMRETNDGQLAVMVYSSLETLAAGAGKEQPWIAVPRDEVPKIVDESGANGVLFDTVIPPSERVHGDKSGDF